MQLNILILGLSVVLLLAVGVFLWGVGKIVYGIAHYYFIERKPERQFRHPHFGVFTSEGDLWTCEVERDGRRWPLLVDGTEEAPSPRLLEQAQSILADFPAWEQRARDFLRSHEPEIRDAPLDLYMLIITDEQHPDNIVFEFIDPSDDSRVWYVEFVAGEPMSTGFDD